MNIFKALRLSNSGIFAIGLAILILSISYSRIVRPVLLPADLQYIPKESMLILAMGDLGKLWEGVDTHFGELLTKPGQPGDPDKILSTIKDMLKEMNYTINTPKDLKQIGLNVDRGLMAGLQMIPGEKTPAGVYVLHIYEVKQFLEFLKKAPGGKKIGELNCRNLADEKIYSIGNLFIGFPEAEIALISNSNSLLCDSIKNRTGNYSYFLENDIIFERVRNYLKKPLASGGTIFLFSRTPRLNYFSDATIAIKFENDALNITGVLTPSSKEFRLFNQILNVESLSSTWSDFLPIDTALVFKFQDSALNRYLDFLLEMDPLTQESNRNFRFFSRRDSTRY